MVCPGKICPPTAKVQAKLDGNLSVSGPGTLTTTPGAQLSAGALRVSFQELSGLAREEFTVYPIEDFQSGYALDQLASDGKPFCTPTHRFLAGSKNALVCPGNGWRSCSR